ncbi:MAG TPA: TRAP transporter substrate-binding protein [Acetobacteraceae bacterium]
MPISRRRLIAGTAALPLVNIGRARSAEFSFKLGNNLPAEHPLNVRASEACKRIAEATRGQIEIKTFPDSQLGSDTEMLKRLQSGEVEFFAMSGLVLSTVVPVSSINAVGFAFKTYGQIWAAMDGKLGAFVRGEIGSRGLFMVGRIWNHGFRQTTTSTKPIRTPDDLRGLKLRVPVSALSASMFGAFGAVTTSMTLNEVHSALESRRMDGQENPLALVQAAKLYEVQQYCSMTNHMWDGYRLVASGAVWQRLSPRNREIIEREFDQAAQDERADMVMLDPHLRGDLAATGLKLNAVDAPNFQQVLQRAGFYQEWRGKYGEAAWRLLEEYAGALA